MKRTLLLALALIAAGCAPSEQSDTLSDGSEQVIPSVSCEDLSEQSPLEDVRTCAEQGNVDAQSYLGFMYDFGFGRVPEDDVEAVRWYRLAAEQGDASAQFGLGSMYDRGLGVPEDYLLAYMWWNLAAAQGDEGAQGSKAILEQRMTSAQIAEAQRLSREWLEAHPPGG